MFSKILLLAAILFSLVYVNQAVRGASIYQNASEYHCIRTMGFEFFIIDAY